MDEPILAIEHSSNLTFSGITFECARGMGVYLEDSENVVFENCVFRNMGTVAVMFGKGIKGADYPIHEFTGFLTSRTIGNLKAHVYGNTDFENNAGNNCGIKQSKIYNTGTGAVILSGGDRKTLTPAGNFIENCDIHDFNRWNKTYCAGITLYGVGNIIRNCYIHEAPHQGIAIFGNEHLIEMNELAHLVMDVHDNGAIYIGRNPSERGNVIRHNFFKEMGQEGFKNCGIHLDDLACGTLVEGNVFYKSSKSDFGDILINGGSDNIIRNNVFMEGAHALWIEDPGQAIPWEIFNKRYNENGLIWKRVYKDVNTLSEVWKEKYPDFKPYDKNNQIIILSNNQFYNNLIIRSKFIVSKHNIGPEVFTKYENNYFVNKDDKDPLITSGEILSTDTIDIKNIIPGFEPIPFSLIKKGE